MLSHTGCSHFKTILHTHTHTHQKREASSLSFSHSDAPVPLAFNTALVIDSKDTEREDVSSRHVTDTSPPSSPVTGGEETGCLFDRCFTAPSPCVLHLTLFLPFHFKGDGGETSERWGWGGAYELFRVHRYYIEWNVTDLNLPFTVREADVSFPPTRAV